MHKGFKCLNISTGCLYISRDVVFDENFFPSASLGSNAGALLHSFLNHNLGIIQVLMLMTLLHVSRYLCFVRVCSNRRTTQRLDWLHRPLLIRALLILRHQTCLRLHVRNVLVLICIRHPTRPHIFCLARTPHQARRRMTLIRPLLSRLPSSPLLCCIRHRTCPLLHRAYLLSGVQYTTFPAPPALHQPSPDNSLLHHLQKSFLTALVYRAASESQSVHRRNRALWQSCSIK
jgi:hypothetical protein